MRLLSHIRRSAGTYAAWLVSALLLIFSAVSLMQAYPTKADDPTAVTGWGWSDNIGWIDFSAENGYGGVHENPTTGVLYGYAWSEHIGWISFNDGSNNDGANSYPNELAGCPSGQCRAMAVNMMTGTNSVPKNGITGWAKALSADGNGWDGWIQFGQGNTGLYAWGSDVVGWIDLAPKFATPVTVPSPCVKNVGNGCTRGTYSASTCGLTAGVVACTPYNTMACSTPPPAAIASFCAEPDQSVGNDCGAADAVAGAFSGSCGSSGGVKVFCAAPPPNPSPSFAIDSCPPLSNDCGYTARANKGCTNTCVGKVTQPADGYQCTVPVVGVSHNFVTLRNGTCEITWNATPATTCKIMSGVTVVAPGGTSVVKNPMTATPSEGQLQTIVGDVILQNVPTDSATNYSVVCTNGVTVSMQKSINVTCRPTPSFKNI